MTGCPDATNPRPPLLIQECALSLETRHIREITFQLSVVSRAQLTQGLLELGNLRRLMVYLEPILFGNLILDRLFKTRVVLHCNGELFKMAFSPL